MNPKDVWNGRARLWVAFWVMGVVCPIVLAALVFFSAVVIVKFTGDAGFGPLLYLIPLSLPVFFALWVFNIVGIWRCAPNVVWRIWTLAARLAVILMLSAPVLLFVYVSFIDKTSDCHLHIPNDCPK